MSDYLFCCRSQSELETVQMEVEQGKYRGVYGLQSNLQREKTGFRCTTCGRFYPFLSIHHMGEVIDPKSLSRPIGKRLKYKKGSYVFRGDHYYATNKKTLLRFDMDAGGNGHQTDETPIMGGVFHVDVSPDERYIATETFGGTIAVIDAATKETIAKKRSCKLNGDFQFDYENRFLYFVDDAIRCWDYFNDCETVLWQTPEEWMSTDSAGRVHHVNCTEVQRLDRERLLFQLRGEKGGFAAILRGLAVEGVFPLADSNVLSTLCYMPQMDQYTLPTNSGVIVYDGQFRPVDLFVCPDMRSYSDGGGDFPVTAFGNDVLHHAYLSPEGKWVLLDYFNHILLMARDSGELRYCVYSDNGGASRFMGFVDERHIWYNWGDSTYIMEIGPDRREK